MTAGSKGGQPSNAGRIAIIGGGIGGLTAAWFLSSKYEVVLFEKEPRLGGNAYTFHTKSGYSMDIAVAVFGKAGYPEFFGLLDMLGIETNLCPNSYMSLHSLDSGRGLYLTPSIKGAGAQRFDLLKPSVIKQIYNLFSRLKKMQEDLDGGTLAGLTFGQSMERAGFKDDARLILLCTLCLLSSMSVEDILNTPADFFLRKLRHHNDVISPKALYSVRCVEGGTRTYIEKMAADIRSRGGVIHTGVGVNTVARSPLNVKLETDQDEMLSFDQVVFACNADQALRMIQEPSELEQKLLGTWKYNECDLVVHRDHSSFPARELIQAYTFLYSEKEGILNTSVNGALWHESWVPDNCEYISTQYPNFPIRKDLVALETRLRTPKFDAESVSSIRRLPQLNGQHRSWFCGSHFGFGLHNDAVSSAMKVAAALGTDTSLKKESESSLSQIPTDVVKGLTGMFKSRFFGN